MAVSVISVVAVGVVVVVSKKKVLQEFPGCGTCRCKGWRQNVRYRGTLLGKRQLNGRPKRHGNGNYGHCCWFRRLNRFSKKTRSKRAFFSKRECHRGTGARWLACGNLEQAAEGRVIGVVVPLGSFRRRPVSVVRSLSVSSGLRETRAPTHSGVPSCRVSRNSPKNPNLDRRLNPPASRSPPSTGTPAPRHSPAHLRETRQ